MDQITLNDAGNYTRCYVTETTTPNLGERVAVGVWASGPKAARKMIERAGYICNALRCTRTGEF